MKCPYNGMQDCNVENSTCAAVGYYAIKRSDGKKADLKKYCMIFKK